MELVALSRGRRKIVQAIVVSVVVGACGVSSEDRENFLQATAGIEWTEEQRLTAGERVCEFLVDWQAEWYLGGEGDPMYLAFDDLYFMTRSAGATRQQANALHGSAVEFLCQDDFHRDTWSYWIRTTDLEGLERGGYP